MEIKIKIKIKIKINMKMKMKTNMNVNVNMNMNMNMFPCLVLLGWLVWWCRPAVAVELYSHATDDETNFNTFENENVAQAHADIVAQHMTLAKAQWQKPTATTATTAE